MKNETIVVAVIGLLIPAVIVHLDGKKNRDHDVRERKKDRRNARKVAKISAKKGDDDG